MIDRVYMGELLTQIWLKSIGKSDAQKESLKNLLGFIQAPCKPTKKCAMKMKERKNEVHVKM